jgi:murein L,D-transpeptidase YcbB/YkuD
VRPTLIKVLLGATAAVAGATATPGIAQSTGTFPAASVAGVYNAHRIQPIWFRNGAVDQAAVNQLVAILQRAPFDGFAEGPQLAAQVQSAVAQAATGDAATKTAADQTLSAAWVQYVQALKRPTPGMAYAFAVLQPQGTRADQILLTAAAAPSLAAYLANTANPNLLYTQLRDAAYANAQATGNLTPDPRILANLDRLRSIPNKGRFMVVDSGNQTLTLFENGRPYDQMKVVAGKTEYPTPMIASIMYYMVYNPYWNAPDHLVRKIAQNYLTMGDSYLKTRGYQVMKDWTAASEVLPTDQVNWKAVASGKEQIRIRQKPSDDNSMGDLKFPFPNNLDIFLHDTPHKEYFARSSRMLSNGCVRLEDAKRLARWLLGREPVAPNGDAEIQVQLPQGVPVYLTYVTAEVRDGKIAYLPDPYGWDKAGTRQIASN